MPNIVDQMTERLLFDAGIGEGMRVLDVGCGLGDVSTMAARLVGTTGQVIGIDKNPAMIEMAENRARQANVRSVSFQRRNLEELAPEDGMFDAVIGRRVLLYQPNPVYALRCAVAVLRSGGIAVFQEHDANPVPSWRTPLPLHQRVHQWIWDMLAREGADKHMGYHLPSSLSKAGLTLEHVRGEAIVQTPEISYPIHEIVRAILPRLTQEGIVSEEEIDVNTLGQRLLEERVRTGATYIGETIFGAWARKV